MKEKTPVREKIGKFQVSKGDVLIRTNVHCSDITNALSNTLQGAVMGVTKVKTEMVDVKILASNIFPQGGVIGIPVTNLDNVFYKKLENVRWRKQEQKNNNSF